MKSRKEKIEFITRVKAGEVSSDEIFITTLNLEKCTGDELEWLLNMKLKLDRGEPATADDEQFFKRFKHNYDARSNLQPPKDYGRDHES